MLEYIPTKQVHQRLIEGWEMVSQERRDYAALMRPPQDWQPLTFDSPKPFRTCSIDGCLEKHKGLGLCRKHYLRQRRPGIFHGYGYEPKNRICSEEGCGKKHKGRGLCDTHLWRARKAEKAAFQCREAA
jgi:hypothetical protein